MSFNISNNKNNKPFVSKAERKRIVNEKKETSNKLTVKTIIGRIALSVGTTLLCLIITVYLGLFLLVNGDCEPLRDKLVLSAMQASATKWLPGLFLPSDTVKAIVESSHQVNAVTLTVDEFNEAENDIENNDIWKNAIDGMLFETIQGDTFTGYVLRIKDPSRMFVGTSSDFKHGLVGMNIFDMAAKENAVAVINAGEFADPGGSGTGNNPMGVTFSKGNCVWNDSLKRTFIGFDINNKLIVTEPMTKAQATELGIRDGVSFQNGNVLITNEDGNITFHYADNNTGTAQRTAIGQAADGTVILLVTDGRSASSLGATRNDVINVMYDYGAVTAGMLDGGSSSLMYYDGYIEKYGYDESKLDQYQKRGLVNRYKAFTNPRRMPTYWCVAAEDTDNHEESEGNE